MILTINVVYIHIFSYVLLIKIFLFSATFCAVNYLYYLTKLLLLLITTTKQYYYYHAVVFIFTLKNDNGGNSKTNNVYKLLW